MGKSCLWNEVICSLTFATILLLPGGSASAGVRPPLPDGADWFRQLEYHLPHEPWADAAGAVGNKIERFIANPPQGEELVLLRTEYAARFAEELKSLRAGARLLESRFDRETGVSRELLELPDGRIRAIESWMTPPSFIRMAIATASSRKAVLSLLSRVGTLRNKGGFGGAPLLHSPSITR